jgi:hypothetical protein
MAEPQQLRSRQSAVALPPPGPLAVPINWREDAARTIKIRYHHAELITALRFADLKPGLPSCIQRQALANRTQITFGSKPKSASRNIRESTR